MYTIINGSPKLINNNSSYFINIICKNLDNYNIYTLKKDNYINIINNINKSKTIILVFPLYVDSPTSITISFLDYIIDNKINLENKSLYTIINCGFRDGKQNITALNIIKRWCDKAKCNYKGSILIGAGEIVGKKKFSFISNQALKNIKYFSKCIKEDNKKELITTMDLLNNKSYCLIGNLFWNRKGKLNKLTKKELKIQ